MVKADAHGRLYKCYNNTLGAPSYVETRVATLSLVTHQHEEVR